MKNLDLNSTVTQNKETLSSSIDDELVLLSILNSKYYGMDSVGKRIWSLLAEPITISELVATLIKEYEITTAECEKDIVSFLGELRSEGLISVSNE